MKVWATKILTEFQHYLQAGDKGIEERCKYLADAIAGTYVRSVGITFTSNHCNRERKKVRR